MKLTINGVERKGVSKGRKSRQVPAEIERLATVCKGLANGSSAINAGNTVYCNAPMIEEKADGEVVTHPAKAKRFNTRKEAQEVYTFVYNLAKRDPSYAHVGVHVFAAGADEFYVYFSDKSVANVG